MITGVVLTSYTEKCHRDRLREVPTIERLRQRLLNHHAARLPGDGDIRRAAVALIMRPGPDPSDVDILFIQRAEHPRDPWSGHMALPGGRVDPEDPTPLATAIRETREEVALDLERHGRHIGRLDDLQAVASGKRLPLVITPFIFELTKRDVELTADTREVQEALWISGSTLRAPTTASTLPYERQGLAISLPCFRVGGRVIWGLTYQMLMRLFSAAGWALPPLSTNLTAGRPPEVAPTGGVSAKGGVAAARRGNASVAPPVQPIDTNTCRASSLEP